MKILILTCSTGEGHNSAAAALQEEFLRRGISSETADALSFLSPRFSRLLCGAHTLVYRRMPRAFSVGYRLEEKHTSRRLFEKVFRDTDALRAFLRQGQFDAVISVHVFAAMMMTQLRRSGERIPLFFVATDYTCSPGVGLLAMDGWFIPHGDLQAEFAACGVPEDRLLPTGIPVRRCFCERQDRRTARRELGLPEEGRMVLLCCGSMGCGPMEELTEELSRILPPDAFSVVLCGTNEALWEELRQKALPRTFAVGFTEKMPLYLDATDLYLTKAGGLSTTEALAKKLPLLYVNAVGGCEARNRAFMLERGYALGAAKNEDIPTLAAAALAEPERLKALAERQGAEFAGSAAEKIIDCVERFCKN